MSHTQASASKKAAALILCPLLGAALLTACTTTEKAKVSQSSGFLGAESTKLSIGGKDQAGMRYANPAAQWAQYNKVLIAPVTFWGAETTKVSATDQQTLVNYFHEQLIDQFKKKNIEVVDQPGPGVVKIAVALVDPEAATPGLRNISIIIPQAHMISNLKYLATGTFPFVGGAQAEMKASDAVTGETLAMAVDKQLGGGSIKTGFQGKWGDAENAIKDWSERLADKLSKWTSGAEKP